MGLPTTTRQRRLITRPMGTRRAAVGAHITVATSPAKTPQKGRVGSSYLVSPPVTVATNDSQLWGVGFTPGSGLVSPSTPACLTT